MTNFITLNNGYQIPQLGFGTIQQFGKQIEDNVAFALTMAINSLIQPIVMEMKLK